MMLILSPSTAPELPEPYPMRRDILAIEVHATVEDFRTVVRTCDGSTAARPVFPHGIPALMEPPDFRRH